MGHRCLPGNIEEVEGVRRSATQRAGHARGQRIAEATGRHDYQWEFKALEDAQANAFCRALAARSRSTPASCRSRVTIAGLGRGARPRSLAPRSRVMAVRAHEPDVARADRTSPRRRPRWRGNDPVVVQSVTALLVPGASVGLRAVAGAAARSRKPITWASSTGQGRLPPDRGARPLVRMGEASQGGSRPAFLSDPPPRRPPESLKSKPDARSSSSTTASLSCCPRPPTP